MTHYIADISLPEGVTVQQQENGWHSVTDADGEVVAHHYDRDAALLEYWDNIA